MNALQINPADNVAVAINPINVDDKELGVEISEAIKQGHKFALRDIKKGEAVIKYGYPIGYAKADIQTGSWVHTHNLASALDGDLEYTYKPFVQCAKEGTKCEQHFWGYPRKHGRPGVRNELWVIPTVGCVNSQARAIADAVRNTAVKCGIDDVLALTHPYGCSQLGDDHANTRRALAALAKHPNAGGVLILGLGCENNQISAFKEELGEYDTKRIRFLTAQSVDDEIAEGIKVCNDLIAAMAADVRKQCDIDDLAIGVKCGGSDGFSGITANPLVGRFTDWLCQRGGTVVLTEVPEMFGAEQILLNRAISPEVFAKAVDMVNSFKAYFRNCGQPIYENPSPGNREGGITTLEEKSLGCVQKGGCAAVTDVLDYAQPAIHPGLNLLWGPGNDMVAATALALSGCQIVLFTTGRGTPLGTCVPTMKIATNSALAAKKTNWIDFDAGTLLDGDTFDLALLRLIDKVIATASGTPLAHERHRSKDIAIFKSGTTL